MLNLKDYNQKLIHSSELLFLSLNFSAGSTSCLLLLYRKWSWRVGRQVIEKQEHRPESFFPCSADFLFLLNPGALRQNLQTKVRCSRVWIQSSSWIPVSADGSRVRSNWCSASCLPVQVSALDQELIEVDPDTKEMLKLLVSFHTSLTQTL